MDVAAFYDAVAPDYACALADDSFEAPLERGLLDRFTAMLPADPLVLDAGCGTGRMIARLRASGVRRVEGVDLSPGMLAEARTRWPDVPLRVADLRDLPYADGVVDGVLAWYSVIHLPPEGAVRAVAEAGRVLRAGGLLLLAFQAGSGTRRTGGYGRDLSTTAVLHEPEDVVAALGPAGMRAVVTARRAPRAGERRPQGLVLARRG